MEINNRFKKAELVAKIGIIANLLLALWKLIIGFYSNSRALIADGVNSASDVAASLVVLLGLKAAKRPPDEDHPYGHGKAESIAAIIVAVLLIIVGFEIGQASFNAFFEPIEAPKKMAIVAIVFSIIVKEILFRYTYQQGKLLQSDALIVTAYDHRADVFSSSAALVGITAAIIGDYVNISWLKYMDPLAGLIVALLILRMAYHLGKEAIHNTLDHVLHDEDTVELRKMVSNVPGVKKIDQFYAREHGHYVIIDVKISVDPYMTVEAGHKVGKEVKKRLMEQKNVANVFIHINPYNPDSNDYEY